MTSERRVRREGHARPDSAGASAGAMLGRFAREGLLGTAHTALDLWWGLLALLVMTVLILVGASLVPLLLVGVVVLVGALVLARGFAALERARFAALLGEVIPPLPAVDAQGAWPRVRQLVGSAGTWTALAWVFLLPFLGTAWAVLVLGLWACALIGLTLPLWRVSAAADSWLATGGAPGALVALTGVAAGLVLFFFFF